MLTLSVWQYSVCFIWQHQKQICLERSAMSVQPCDCHFPTSTRFGSPIHCSALTKCEKWAGRPRWQRCHSCLSAWSLFCVVPPPSRKSLSAEKTDGGSSKLLELTPLNLPSPRNWMHAPEPRFIFLLFATGKCRHPQNKLWARCWSCHVPQHNSRIEFNRECDGLPFGHWSHSPPQKNLPLSLFFGTVLEGSWAVGLLTSQSTTLHAWDCV